MKLQYILIAFFCILLFNIAFAQVPRTITHQGYLTRSSGQPYDTTISMTFRLFQDSTGGSSVWVEAIPSVTVTRGVYNVTLGRITTLSVAFDKQYWLEVVAGSQTLSPRRRLTASPYSLGPWSTNGTNIYYNAGNVGIGTSAPSHKLEIQTAAGGLQFAERLTNPTTGDASGHSVGTLFSIESVTDHGKGALVYERTASWGRGKFHFLQNQASDATNPTLSDAVFTVDNSGSVGIGTNAPNFRLNVAQDITMTSDVDPGSAQFSVGGTGGNVGKRMTIGYDVNGNGFGFIKSAWYTQAWTPLVLQPNGGNVGIGTTSPSQKLSVSGNICYTGSIGACSDLRYKKNITPLSNALDKVSQIQGVTYNWKVDEFPEQSFTHDRQIGVIAQQIEKIYPELVLTDAKGYKSVDYAKLTPVLVEAVKELKAKNEILESRLDNLETMVKSLAAEKNGVGKKSMGEVR